MKSGYRKSKKTTSLRAFAKAIGVSHVAVLKGVKAGRLTLSLGRTRANAPVIKDLELAKKEWSATSRTGAGAPDAGAATTGGKFVSAATLSEAQRLATNERARKLKLENDVKEGRLVPVERVAKETFEIQRIVRESMLNIPARIAGELAAETDATKVYMRLDAAIREALGGAAESLQATVNA